MPEISNTSTSHKHCPNRLACGMNFFDPASTRPFSWPLLPSPPIRHRSLCPATLNVPFQPTLPVLVSPAFPPHCQPPPRFKASPLRSLCYLFSATSSRPIFSPDTRSLRVAYQILCFTVPVPFQRSGIALASCHSVLLWMVACYLFFCSAYSVLVPSIPSSIKGRPPIAVSRDCIDLLRTESTLSDDEIDEEMSENDAIAEGTSNDDRSLSDQADPYSYHLIFMASSEASDTDTDASASDVSNDEPGAPPPSHVATDEELRALEREVFDYDPSVDDSWYTTDDDSDADSEMSDIPAPPVPHSPRNFPLHEIRDLDVDVIVDPRLRYNPFRFFPVHTLPVIPPANPPSLPRRMFESVFIDLVDRLRHLLAMLSAGQPIYHQIDVSSH
ncbi:hypothetical protein PGT21_026462 [Puccinia graminis f. sp. tritici]|uniref:Uncharacterized protein n=1 Tax=Puccinia graminis f. sp. tritici TaxID=56615 RepID=A0A5B0MVK7_PUCGR|nr:hypothetical protein PGT21_026462 [Puccinia graminis f. sp. tritici]